MALQLGKRYRCPKCGLEVLVTKAGDGMVSCHEEMQVQGARPTPSSD